MIYDLRIKKLNKKKISDGHFSNVTYLGKDGR